MFVLYSVRAAVCLLVCVLYCTSTGDRITTYTANTNVHTRIYTQKAGRQAGTQRVIAFSNAAASGGRPTHPTTADAATLPAYYDGLGRTIVIVAATMSD